jgi:hypothetical protein
LPVWLWSGHDPGQKLTNSDRCGYGVKIWKAIAEAAAEIGPLVIKCGSYRADRPGDFEDLPERPYGLVISAVAEDGRAVEIELSGRDSRVVLTEPDSQCTGVLTRIREVCARSRRGRLPKYKIALFLTAAAVTTISFSSIVTLNNPALGIIGAVVGWALFAAGLFIGLRIATRRAVLLNVRREDRPSFWRRTRDDWAVQIAGGLVLLALGILLGKVSG